MNIEQLENAMAMEHYGVPYAELNEMERGELEYDIMDAIKGEENEA